MSPSFDLTFLNMIITISQLAKTTSSMINYVILIFLQAAFIVVNSFFYYNYF